MGFIRGKVIANSNSQFIDLGSRKRYIIITNKSKDSVYILLSNTSPIATTQDLEIKGFGKLRAKGAIRYFAAVTQPNATAELQYIYAD